MCIRLTRFAALLCATLVLLQVDCLPKPMGAKPNKAKNALSSRRFRNIRVRASHNMDTQSRGAQTEIANICAKLDSMSSLNIERVLRGTLDGGKFTRQDTLGLHAMKEGTLLEGLASIDLHLDQNNHESGPGPARLLFDTKYGKSHLDALEFVGVVDTHGEHNVRPWSEVVARGEREHFFEVKNVRGESIGVRKFASIGNTNNKAVDNLD